MIPEAYIQLFNTLCARTSAGEVNWSRSAQRDTYVVAFGQFGLSVWRSDPDGGGDVFVRFRLFNDLGREADTFWVTPNEPQWEQAEWLYEGARKKAHRIDVTLGSILEGLKQPGPVGDSLPEVAPAADDDDLPF